MRDKRRRSEWYEPAVVDQKLGVVVEPYKRRVEQRAMCRWPVGETHIERDQERNDQDYYRNDLPGEHQKTKRGQTRALRRHRRLCLRRRYHGGSFFVSEIGGPQHHQ